MATHEEPLPAWLEQELRAQAHRGETEMTTLQVGDRVQGRVLVCDEREASFAVQDVSEVVAIGETRERLFDLAQKVTWRKLADTYDHDDGRPVGATYVTWVTVGSIYYPREREETA